MRLKNSFYTIVKKEIVGESVRYDIELSSNHVIYKAHFPKQKVTPGVCVLQIAKELLEEYLQVSLEIISVKNAKFLSVISPDKNPYIAFIIGHILRNDEMNIVKAQVSVEGMTQSFAKLSFNCCINENQ